MKSMFHIMSHIHTIYCWVCSGLSPTMWHSCLLVFPSHLAKSSVENVATVSEKMWAMRRWTVAAAQVWSEGNGVNLCLKPICNSLTNSWWKGIYMLFCFKAWASNKSSSMFQCLTFNTDIFSSRGWCRCQLAARVCSSETTNQNIAVLVQLPDVGLSD